MILRGLVHLVVSIYIILIVFHNYFYESFAYSGILDKKRGSGLKATL